MEVRRLTYEFIRTGAIKDIKIEDNDLAETVIFTDKDLTISIPGRPGVLRGGEESLEVMTKFSKIAWGYYIVTAKEGTSAEKLDVVLNELKAIRVDGVHEKEEEKDLDIRHLFTSSFITNESKEKITAVPELLRVKGDENSPPNLKGIIFDNIIINGLNKAVGAINAISRSTKATKIKQIIFIDDFITNSIHFALDLNQYLEKNLSDRLSDTVNIVCVWLDPALDLNKRCQEIASHTSENSHSLQFKPYVDIFYAVRKELEEHELIALSNIAYQQSVTALGSQKKGPPVVIKVAESRFTQFAESKELIPPIIINAEKFISYLSRLKNKSVLNNFKKSLGLTENDNIIEITAAKKPEDWTIEFIRNNERITINIIQAYKAANSESSLTMVPV